MDSFEFSKILGAVLAAGLVASLSGFVAEQVYPDPNLEAQAAAVTAREAPAEPKAAGAPEPEAAGIAVLLAAAEPDAGRKVFKKCAACHGTAKGGKHKIGPNLWDVVGRPVASAEGYAFSNALKGKSGEAWSYGNLDAFLRKPKDWAPRTKMSFAGLRKPAQRAALIVYLRSLSDNPAALPE